MVSFDLSSFFFFIHYKESHAIFIAAELSAVI